MKDEIQEKIEKLKKKPFYIVLNDWDVDLEKDEPFWMTFDSLEDAVSECGLIEFTEENGLYTTVPAPFRESIRPTWNFTAALLRRLHEKAEVAKRDLERKTNEKARI